MTVRSTRPRALPTDLEDELRAIATEAGCDLLEVGFHGNALRVVLDRPDEGVTIEHCTTVSRQLSALLDVHDFGRERYVLEVTSPGLDRPLYDSADYERFTGRLIRVTFRDDGDGAKRTTIARLAAFDRRDAGLLTLADESTEATWQIPLGDVERAQLEVEL